MKEVEEKKDYFPDIENRKGNLLWIAVGGILATSSVIGEERADWSKVVRDAAEFVVLAHKKNKILNQDPNSVEDLELE